MTGDADIAKVAAVLASPGRARILLALGDGRALPASVLAAEAGVAPSTASEHLAKLTEAGLLVAERQGRHRYHRIAGPHVARLLETLAQAAPAAPVRSLRQGTRAHAVRTARTCYDHLAGRLGTALMAAMLDDGWLDGGDGTFDRARARADRLSAPGADLDYRVTPRGRAAFARELDIDVEDVAAGRRALVRYCVDWSEQRHHLAGALGAALATRVLDLGWVRRAPAGRAVFVTAEGVAGLRSVFGLAWDEGRRPARDAA